MNQTQDQIYPFLFTNLPGLHIIPESHETAVKRMFRYLQGTKDNVIVFNQPKKLVVDCYYDADFAGLWGSSRPIFMIGVELDEW